MSEVARHAVVVFLRQLAVAIITAVVIVLVLVVAFRGQSTAERELQQALVTLQEETLKATLAEACVLALPVDAETGRDERSVQECFTQYDLEPPRIVSGG